MLPPLVWQYFILFKNSISFLTWENRVTLKLHFMPFHFSTAAGCNSQIRPLGVSSSFRRCARPHARPLFSASLSCGSPEVDFIHFFCCLDFFRVIVACQYQLPPVYFLSHPLKEPQIRQNAFGKPGRRRITQKPRPENRAAEVFADSRWPQTGRWSEDRAHGGDPGEQWVNKPVPHPII